MSHRDAKNVGRGEYKTHSGEVIKKKQKNNKIKVFLGINHFQTSRPPL